MFAQKRNAPFYAIARMMQPLKPLMKFSRPRNVEVEKAEGGHVVAWPIRRMPACLLLRYPGGDMVAPIAFPEA
jgi:hypothetical protein